MLGLSFQYTGGVSRHYLYWREPHGQGAMYVRSPNLASTGLHAAAVAEELGVTDRTVRTYSQSTAVRAKKAGTTQQARSSRKSS